MRTYLKLASLVTTEPGASPARALDNVSGARLELGDAALKRIGLRSSQGHGGEGDEEGRSEDGGEVHFDGLVVGFLD